MSNDVQEAVLKPKVLRSLMKQHGIRSILKLSQMSGAAYTSLYQYIKRKRRNIGPLTRRRLAAVFPDHAHLFITEKPRADA